MKKLCVILSVVVLVAAVLAGVFYVRTGNLNNDLTAVKADMETKTAELTSAKASIESMTAEIAALNEQLTAAQGDAEAKAAEIATLTEQLTAAQNDAEAKAAEAAARAEKEKNKAEKAAQKAKAAPAPAEPAAEISFEHFKAADLRVGTVRVCERHPNADRILRLEIDFGEGQPRQILSGLAEYFAPEELVGRQVCAVLNLAPRKIRGLVSHGMVLTAEQEGRLVLLQPGGPMPDGSRIG